MSMGKLSWRLSNMMSLVCIWRVGISEPKLVTAIPMIKMVDFLCLLLCLGLLDAQYSSLACLDCGGLSFFRGFGGVWGWVRARTAVFRGEGVKKITKLFSHPY